MPPFCLRHLFFSGSTACETAPRLKPAIHPRDLAASFPTSAFLTSPNSSSNPANIAKMTSLAVLPPLQKTITDLMDEDLYQAPQSPLLSHMSDLGRTGLLTSSPAMTANTAAATLSHLLNIPDSFVEHYNRVNGSSNAVNSIPSLFLDNSNDYSSYEADAASTKVNPFNSHANPDLFQQQQLLLLQTVRPELVQMRSTIPSTRRRRITTLDDHEPSVKPSKDEDYYLFNTDIQPSMTSRNFFSSEDYLYSDNSLFIMSDKKGHNTNSRVPGFESDYLALDEFAEDAEELSEDSDDDNYFQDDNDDFDEYIMNSNDFSLGPVDSYMPVRSLPQAEDLRNVPAEDYLRHADVTLDMDLHSQEDGQESDVEDEMMIDEEHEAPPAAKYHEEYHKTAAEITATNPNHQCELVNPSTGHPCNKQFSRPYDLIRHQETIHASRKKIFRCVICEGRYNGGAGNGKSKTFSRGDALSRHIKVKHGLGGQEAVDLINEAKENVEYLLF